MNKHLTFKEFNYDKFIGERILFLDYYFDSENIKVVKGIQKDHYIVKDSEGRYGFVGYGKTWFLCYLTQTGPCVFNPMKDLPEKVTWEKMRNCYVLKKEFEIFKYYLKPGVRYKIINNIPIIDSNLYSFLNGGKSGDPAKLLQCYE